MTTTLGTRLTAGRAWLACALLSACQGGGESASVADAEPPNDAQGSGVDAAAGTSDAAPAPVDDAAPVPPDDARRPPADGMTPVDAQALPDAAPPAPDARPRFRFGISASDRHKMMPAPIFHVDHDAEAHPEAPATCTNYAGLHFPNCYDDHSGTDFMLGGGFSTMDNGSAEVVAAAGGVVEHVEEGHYDRCHGSAATLEVTCDGHEMRANFVRLRHANGWVSLYYHLKSGSVRVVEGQRVACGELLGLVGSSGRSTLPHLHFQVEDPAGEVVDPYAPAERAGDSLFVEQDAPDGLPGESCDPAWSAAP